MNRQKIILCVGVAAFVVVSVWWVVWARSGQFSTASEDNAEAEVADSEAIASLEWPRSTASTSDEDTQGNPKAGGGKDVAAASTNKLAALEEPFTFTPEQLAEYLRRNGTNAESLLVAAQLSTNRTEFFKLAAKLYPDDPRVQFAVVAHDVFPEAKREWLERFKQSAPENSLADFLSAREYAKTGDRESAIRDLLEAAGRPHFNDYTLDRWQTSEEAQLQAGRSVAEAKASSAMSLLLPHLAQLKSLATEMETWQKDYRTAGDMASAQNLAQIGSTIAGHLLHGEGSHYLINQLVGVAIERKVLSQLPPESQPEFLRGTVQERFDELTRFREEAKRLSGTFERVVSNNDEAAVISYFDRLKLQGEFATLKWFDERAR